MSIRKALNAAAAERILLFDGAFGTMIQNARLSEDDFAGDSICPPRKAATTIFSRLPGPTSYER